MTFHYNDSVETLVEFIKMLGVAIVIAVVIRTFIIQPYVIPSESMRETLQNGDRIFVSKFSYGIHLPFITNEVISTGDAERGDIVVFPSIDKENPGIDFVKRVVGIGGDVIEIRNKQLYRNGEAMKEPYIQHSDLQISNGVRDNMPSITVPEGHVFVMGDNRDNSRDSRFWGCVDKKTIVGKAFIIYWSSRDFVNIKWDRIGKMLY